MMGQATNPKSDNDRARLNETRRRYYLQVLGVDLYVPRVPLSSAKPSNLPEPLKIEPAAITRSIPRSIATSDSTSTDTQSSPIRVKALKPTQKVEIVIEPKATSVVDGSGEGLESAASESVRGLRFQLRVWRVSNDLLILDTRGKELALPTDPLLRNMIKALGYAQESLGQSDLIRWPIPGYAVANDSETDARAMVRAFIEAQQQKFGVGTVLLMGEAASEMALPAPNSEPLLWQHIPVFEDCDGIALPSLTQLLKDPSLKKQTWLSIRHLCLQPDGTLEQNQ